MIDLEACRLIIKGFKTREDKFERKWWVDNRAKRVWVRFEKRANRRKFRRMTKV